jgi:hypothetical protein
MNTVNIKGKPYVTVNERLKHIAANFQYSIKTDFTYYPERKMWVVKATLSLFRDGVECHYTGLAQEIESDNYKEVNFSSALENAETSAVGRACAMAGIGIDGGIASADEVNKALNRQVDEVGEESRLYLITLLENTTYEERQKETLAHRINNLLSKADYEKALANLQMNQIEDKDRIAMGMAYNQSDIKKTLKSKGI